MELTRSGTDKTGEVCLTSLVNDCLLQFFVTESYECSWTLVRQQFMNHDYC